MTNWKKNWKSLFKYIDKAIDDSPHFSQMQAAFLEIHAKMTEMMEEKD